MNLTWSNIGYLILGCVIVFLLVSVFIFCAEPNSFKPFGIAAGVIVAIAICICFFLSWYNTNTAAGIRDYKDFQSNLANGIEREITITAEDGRQIYHYQGKIDVESDHEDNYIKFEREDGGREIIYYGITDTVLITEIK